MADRSRAVVLLSGGLDSTTALAIANSEGFESYALSFRYGQRHVAELAAAQRVATNLQKIEFALRFRDGRGQGGTPASAGDIELRSQYEDPNSSLKD